MGSLCLGIDIGKFTDAYCLVSASLLKQRKSLNKLPQGSIKNNHREDFESLLALARAEAGSSTIHVLCEHTGHYGYLLEQFLQEQPGVKVYRILAKKRYGRDKTDKKDAQALAVRLYNQVVLHIPITDESERIMPLRPPIPVAAQCRTLVGRRIDVMHALNRCGNRLTSICDQLFPELTEIYAAPNGASALNLRERFPTTQAVAEATLPELFATRLRTRPGNKAFVRLRELAKQSVGLKPGARQQSLVIEQGQLISEMRLLLLQQAALDQQIDAILAGSREATILQSFPGIGPVLASQLIAGIGNIQNFPSLVRFRSYAGCAPRKFQTGNSHDRTDTDRAGNRLCKIAMRQATLCAISHSERWATIHRRLMGGPHALGAMGRVTGQFCGVVYHLLKRDAELIARCAPGDELPEPQLYDLARRH